MFGKLAYCSLKLRLLANLNNQIQLVSETRLSGLALTSVICPWLTAKPFGFFRFKSGHHPDGWAAS